MKKLYAIGDVHGCYNALTKLLYKIGIDKGDSEATVVFLGDYVDRGSRSADVVQTLIDLQSYSRRPGAKTGYVFLMGNHEDMMLDPSMYSTWMYNGGLETLNSYEKYHGSALLNHQKWLKDNLKLYHTIDDYLFVHAGISPNQPVEDQDRDIFLWDRNFVKYDGDYVGGWKVIHGHTPIESPLQLRNQLNIDTGCVFGKSYSEFGNLTAAVLHDGWENVRYIQSREIEIGE